MKNLAQDFKSSIFNPDFYSTIEKKSLKEIFLYIFKVDLIISLVATLAITIFFVQGPASMQSPDAAWIARIIGPISVFISTLLATYIIWVLYAWIFGIIIMLVSMILKKRMSYTISVKIAMYAMSLGMILILIPNIPIISWLVYVIPIVIVIINLKRKAKSSTV